MTGLAGGDNRNIIGSRGESIFYTLLTRRVDLPGQAIPAGGYLFEPQFLGDKWPFADYFVELRGTEPTLNAFFFVQVKTTTLGYTQQKKRLKAGADAAKIQGLTAYPAPTYLVGIDQENEQGFLVSANNERQTRLPAVSTAFPLSDGLTRWTLWQEVLAYWQTPAIPKLVSAFVDPNWR